MRVFEAFNETATKEYLKGLHGKAKVSFNDVYRVLGVEKAINPIYGYGVEGHFLSYLNRYITYPQRNKQPSRDYLNMLKQCYTQGDYFHMFGDDAAANERMIINIKTQEGALILITHLLTVIPHYIRALKYYGVKQQLDKKFKYDKIVIYYNTSNRDDLYNAIKASPIGGELFLKAISGFYHLYDDGNEKYFVGIGKEVGGTSFTTETTYAILSEMTGKTISYLKGVDNGIQLDVKADIKSLSSPDLAIRLFTAGKQVC